MRTLGPSYPKEARIKFSGNLVFFLLDLFSCAAVLLTYQLSKPIKVTQEIPTGKAIWVT